MDVSSKKRSTIFPHNWFKALEKLPDDVAGRIYKAVQRLDITGKMTEFEEGSIEDILFSQYADQTAGFKQSYAETCENKSKAAKEREAAKKHKKHNEAQANSVVEDRIGKDRIGVDRIGVVVSGGDVSGEDACAPSADTTTTTPAEEQIVRTWNQHEFVQKIKRVDSPQKRRDQTEMAIAVAGGLDPFLEVLSSLDQQAYLKDQPDSGYKVIYDWLIQPDTFQSLLEGKYKEKRKDKFEGWEVVGYG